jgi:outer membrane immunogenic protein
MAGVGFLLRVVFRWLGEIMRILSFILSAAGLVLANSNQSAAADLPIVRNVPPVIVAQYNWTGFYAGGHAGYGWSSSNVSVGVADPLNLATAAVLDGAFALRYSLKRDGYVAGGQIGYNHQFERWLLGRGGRPCGLRHPG